MWPQQSRRECIKKEAAAAAALFCLSAEYTTETREINVCGSFHYIDMRSILLFKRETSTSVMARNKRQ
jgi:hypothetical protein